MSAISRLRLPITFIVAFVFAVLLALAAFLSTAEADHSWGDYHWARTSNPLKLKLGDNVSTKWDTYLQTTSSDWSESTVLDTTVVAGQATSKNCKPPSGRAEVCNSRYGWNGWLGLVQIWVSGKHITQGATKVNDTYFDDYKWYDGKFDTPAWRQGTLCQEVGHVFGLDHQDESGADFHTCMDYSSNPDADNMEPNQHDYEQLEEIYSHLDSTTTTSRLPAAAEQEDLNDPRTWGRLIRKEGRHEVWERNYGGGQKLFTFVIRADKGDQPGEQKKQDSPKQKQAR